MEAIPSIVSESPAPIEKRRLLSDLKDDAAHKGCCGSLRRHGYYVFALSVVAALGIALIAMSVRGPHGSDAACDVSVVESIPLNTTGLSSGAESTYAAFLWLLDNANLPDSIRRNQRLRLQSKVRKNQARNGIPENISKNSFPLPPRPKEIESSIFAKPYVGRHGRTGNRPP